MGWGKDALHFRWMNPVKCNRLVPAARPKKVWLYMHTFNSPLPILFFFFLHKLLARSQLPHCCSLHQKWKLCLLCTKWQTPHVPYEKGVHKTHAENIKEGQRWCFGNEDFSKWGKQKIKVIVTVTAVYSNGQITNKYSHYRLVLSLPEWVKSPK